MAEENENLENTDKITELENKISELEKQLSEMELKAKRTMIIY